MISDNNIIKLRNCFSGQININKLREDLNIKRGNNTLRDFILGLNDDPGIMALEKMADYANMDFMLVPIKKIDRLDSISKQQEEEFIKKIESRYDEFCLHISSLVSTCPKKISTKKEPKTKRVIDLQNSNKVIDSLLLGTAADQSLDDIFSTDMDIGSLPDGY